MKYLIFSLSIFLAGLVGCGSKSKPSYNIVNVDNCAENEMLTVEQMQEDISYLFTVIKEGHPRPYYRYSEVQIDSVQQVLKDKCSEPMCTDRFKYTIAQSNKYLDLHSGFSLSYSDSIYVPLTSWIDFVNEEMRLGDFLIQEINGIPASDIAKMMDNVISWEHAPNSSRFQKNKWLTRVLRGYYGFELPYQCKVINSKTGKKTNDYMLDKFDYRPIMPEITNFDTIHHRLAHSSQFFDSDHIAIFYYNTSYLDSDDELKKFDKAAVDFFSEVETKQIKDVFIDVSFNGGGSDNVHPYLMKHLSLKPYSMKFTFYNSAEKLRAFEENPKIDSLSLAKFKESEIFNGESTIESEEQKGYNGNVYVIMGAWTFSAAYNFCDNMKRPQAGILVGETAGQHFPFVGEWKKIKLPHSGIIFRCGTNFLDFEPSLTDSEGFLQPDIPYKLDHTLKLEDFKKIISLSKEKN